MKIIVYAGTELMTGDDIADAVLDYSAALAQEGAAETIEIPILESDGRRSSAIILVGPASQIVAKGALSTAEEIVDVELVATLERRTRSHRPVAVSSAPRTDVRADYDEDWATDI